MILEQHGGERSCTEARGPAQEEVFVQKAELWAETQGSVLASAARCVTPGSWASLHTQFSHPHFAFPFLFLPAAPLQPPPPPVPRPPWTASPMCQVHLLDPILSNTDPLPTQPLLPWQ